MNPTRLVISSVCALAALTGIFGFDAIRSHLSTLRGEVGGAVREASPDAYEAKRIEALIRERTRRVQEFGDKIADIAARAATERKEATALAGQLAADRAALATEKELLQQEATTYDIQGRTYTRAQLEASALARLARCQRNESALETKRQVAEQLDAAVRDGQARLQEATAARDESLRQLELLAARAGNARLKKELAELANPLRQGVLPGEDGELSQSFRAYEQRVRKLEREGELQGQPTTEPTIIPHDATPARGGLLEQMEQYLAQPGQTS
jgi:hypothetical protein